MVKLLNVKRNWFCNKKGNCNLITSNSLVFSRTQLNWAETEKFCTHVLKTLFSVIKCPHQTPLTKAIFANFPSLFEKFRTHSFSSFPYYYKTTVTKSNKSSKKLYFSFGGNEVVNFKSKIRKGMKCFRCLALLVFLF